ncbi:MAG: type II toxin-antitoxin system RelE/ParE family toxin [Actinomycetota bacterium]|nr:type II toxin-antitoxin system RelE/ParE family toxin [Actinomycetota bacterium]
MILNIHEDADRELNDAADYYDAESLGLGTAFLDQLDDGYQRILENPHAAAEIDPDIRKLVLAKFPYNLIYEIDGDVVLILAVAHQRRRPHYWRERRAG